MERLEKEEEEEESAQLVEREGINYYHMCCYLFSDVLIQPVQRKKNLGLKKQTSWSRAIYYGFGRDKCYDA